MRHQPAHPVRLPDAVRGRGAAPVPRPALRPHVRGARVQERPVRAAGVPVAAHRAGGRRLVGTVRARLAVPGRAVPVARARLHTRLGARGRGRGRARRRPVRVSGVRGARVSVPPGARVAHRRRRRPRRRGRPVRRDRPVAARVRRPIVPAGRRGVRRVLRAGRDRARRPPRAPLLRPRARALRGPRRPVAAARVGRGAHGRGPRGRRTRTVPPALRAPLHQVREIRVQSECFERSDPVYHHRCPFASRAST